MTTAFRSPEILRIEELVRRVKDGDIKLPKFQRPFVWKRADVLMLWDSIYKGYPIGSVLLWLTRQRLASEREIGDLNVSPRAEEYPTNYLLDGQQRLSSLCGVLFWPGKDPKSIWNVAFDLRDEHFFHPEEALSAWHFPLSRLLETREFLAQCALFQHLPDATDLNERAQRLLSSVKDYKVAAVILADMDLNKVGPVFERINSKGRRLTIVDLMRAATWTDSFDMNDTFNEILAFLQQAGFDGTDTKAILRNLSAACGKGITVDGIDKLRSSSEAQLRSAGSAVAGSYRLAVDFLKSDVGVPSSHLLPYQLQLTLLSEFFRLRPTPLPAVRAELVRWFWRTSLTSYFKGANTTQMKEDLARMIAFAKSEVGLAEQVPVNLTAGDFIAQRFKLNTAQGQAFALLLANGRPRSLLDGSAMDLQVVLAMANRVEYHHIFPKGFLGRETVSVEKQNCLANICITNLVGNRRFGSTAPSQYLQKAANAWGAEADEIRRSNFMSDLAWLYAIEDKFDDFCEARAQLLCEHALMLTGG